MIGENIKIMRKQNNLTQEQLEKKTGIPQSTISWLEKIEQNTLIENLTKLADYYKISIDELIGRNFF